MLLDFGTAEFANSPRKWEFTGYCGFSPSVRTLSALGGEVFLGEVNGGRAVGGRGDDLPDGLGSDVARGEHPGQRGPRRFISDDVAASVQLGSIPNSV